MGSQAFRASHYTLAFIRIKIVLRINMITAVQKFSLCAGLILASLTSPAIAARSPKDQGDDAEAERVPLLQEASNIPDISIEVPAPVSQPLPTSPSPPSMRSMEELQAFINAAARDAVKTALEHAKPQINAAKGKAITYLKQQGSDNIEERIKVATRSTVQLGVNHENQITGMKFEIEPKVLVLTPRCGNVEKAFNPEPVSS